MAKWFEKMPKRVFDRAVEAGLVATGIHLVSEAVVRVPSPGRTGTGRTKGSLTFATQKVGAKVEGPARQSDGVARPSGPYTVHVGTNVEYASYLEYGTRRMPARPYLRPALDDNRKDIKKIFMREIMREYGR